MCWEGGSRNPSPSKCNVLYLRMHQCTKRKNDGAFGAFRALSSILFSSRNSEWGGGQVTDPDIASYWYSNFDFCTSVYLFRLLFWIERKTNSQFSLYKYELSAHSKGKVKLVSTNLKAPNWVTVDPTQNRVYWSNISYVFSSTFEGGDLQVLTYQFVNSLKTYSLFYDFD